MRGSWQLDLFYNSRLASIIGSCVYTATNGGLYPGRVKNDKTKERIRVSVAASARLGDE